MEQQLREFFRVNLTLEIFSKKILFDEKNSKYYLDTVWQPLKTKDISAKGMFVYNENLKGTFEENNHLLIKFTIPEKLDESIYLIAKIIRIIDAGFALDYNLIDDFDRDKLINSFLKIAHEKATKKFD